MVTGHSSPVHLEPTWDTQDQAHKNSKCAGQNKTWPYAELLLTITDVENTD